MSCILAQSDIAHSPIALLLSFSGHFANAPRALNLSGQTLPGFLHTEYSLPSARQLASSDHPLAWLSLIISSFAFRLRLQISPGTALVMETQRTKTKSYFKKATERLHLGKRKVQKQGERK